MPPKQLKIASVPDESTAIPLSLVQQIADLAPGATVSLAERIHGDMAIKEILQDALDRLRNKTAAAVKRAKAKSGHTYTVESGEFRTRTMDIVVVVAISRTA